jgi:hypothetical protein
MIRSLTLATTSLLAVACAQDIYAVSYTKGRLEGRVVDMDGDPLGGARVFILDDHGWDEGATTDAQGWFQTRKQQGNHWLLVEADGYLSRARPAGPDEPTLFRLSEDDGTTVRIVFVGSTGFGQGYYDRGLLRPGLEPQDVPATLAGMLPLLEGVQHVNGALESPLSVHDQAHDEKPSIYRSHPLVAPGLSHAGFDMVHLANDHIYDLLEHGLVETLAQLEAAGLDHQGAGLDQAEAWAPIQRDVGAVRVSTLGCTTVTGADYTTSLVADDEAGKGGAAACDWEWLDAMVAQAAEQADLTVVQLHGGTSLDPNPTQAIASLAERAADGGADLVINHHPRVNGGLSLHGDTLIVESLGAFASDLALWSTFPSALLEVQVRRDGSLERATIEPLLRDALRPMAVLGWPRQRIARDILARSDAPVALDDGALELDIHGRSQLEERSVPLQAAGGIWSFPVDLRDGWFSGAQGGDDWQLGTDLLRVGDFEDIDVDGELAEGSLWDLDSSYEWISDRAAYSGSYGLRLSRDTAQTQAVWSSPAHRMPVDPERRLTLSGWVRGNGAMEIQLSWYDSSSGESFERALYPYTPSDDWDQLLIELEPPAEAAYAQVFLMLQPSERGQVHADIDALRLIAWTPDHPDDTTPYDSIRLKGDTTVSMRRRVMPVSADR